MGLYAASRQFYFVGTDDSGLITLYRGVPYELPLGINLYSKEYESGCPRGRAARAGSASHVLDN